MRKIIRSILCEINFINLWILHSSNQIVFTYIETILSYNSYENLDIYCLIKLFLDRVLSNTKSMQNLYCERKINVSTRSFIGLLSLLLLSAGCGTRISGNKIQAGNSMNQISESVDQPTYIKFRSFQNSDSTWGFTIFVNSRPYLHHRRIPLSGVTTGFGSKEDAEKVAGLFVKKIQEGDTSPELNNKILDSLEILTRK